MTNEPDFQNVLHLTALRNLRWLFSFLENYKYEVSWMADSLRDTIMLIFNT